MCMTTAAIITTVAAVATPIAAAEVASHGANSAADTNAKAATDSSNAQLEATKYATDAQTKANQEALAFQQQQYADQQARLAPYRTIGQGAVGRLSDLYGLSAPSVGGAPPVAGIVSAMKQNPAPAIGSALGQIGGGVPSNGTMPSQSATAPMVTVQAPDGETRQMSSDLAQHYLGLGKGYALMNHGANA